MTAPTIEECIDMIEVVVDQDEGRQVTGARYRHCSGSVYRPSNRGG